MNNFDQDTELMLKFKDGDLSAFETLVKKYKKSVLNIIFRFLPNCSQAEDLAQEVFLRIYKSAINYKPSAKFSTYLYRITANLCLNFQRDYKQLFSLDEIDYPLIDHSQSTPEELTEKKEISKIVQEALSSLPENQRLALIFCKYENKSYQEIAKIMGISVSAVKALIFRARENLKMKLLRELSNFTLNEEKGL